MYDDARATAREVADSGVQRTWALPKLLWLLPGDGPAGPGSPCGTAATTWPTG